jgi:hypothetical protein
MTDEDHVSAAGFFWEFSANAPAGVNLLLLTSGNIAIISNWSKDAGNHGWARIPGKKNFTPATEEHHPPSGPCLLLTVGGTVLIDRYLRDPHFIAWHPLPSSMREK